MFLLLEMCVYRSKHHEINSAVENLDFMFEFEAWVNGLVGFNSPTVICGYFNINLLDNKKIDRISGNVKFLWL